MLLSCLELSICRCQRWRECQDELLSSLPLYRKKKARTALVHSETIAEACMNLGQTIVRSFVRSLAQLLLFLFVQIFSCHGHEERKDNMNLSLFNQGDACSAVELYLEDRLLLITSIFLPSTKRMHHAITLTE